MKEPVAYFSEVQGFGDRGVVAGRTRAQARYRVFASLHAAGYSQYGFQHIKVRRARNYDLIAPILDASKKCATMWHADLLYAAEVAARS